MLLLFVFSLLSLQIANKIVMETTSPSRVAISACLRGRFAATKTRASGVANLILVLLHNKQERTLRSTQIFCSATTV